MPIRTRDTGTGSMIIVSSYKEIIPLSYIMNGIKIDNVRVLLLCGEVLSGLRAEMRVGARTLRAKRSQQVCWILESTQHLLSWRCTVLGHLSEYLLSLRVRSGAGAAASWLAVFMVIDLKIITLSCGLACLPSLSICACFWDFGACRIKYMVVGVVINGMHVLQLQSRAFSEILFALLFAILLIVGVNLSISNV